MSEENKDTLDQAADKVADKIIEAMNRGASKGGLQINDDSNVKVKGDRDTEGRDGALLQTSRMINALRDNRPDKLTDARSKLMEGGHYDKQLQMRGVDTNQRHGENYVRSGLNTLTFADGGVFVPDIVIDDVAMQEDMYGVVRRRATRVPLVPGVQRYPKITSKADFTHVGEGQAIQAKKLGFGSVELRPRKAAMILPWTRETDDVAGAAIMPRVNQVIAERREKLIDEDAFLGDGSSTYGNINGILGGNLSNVVSVTMGSGKTSFADADFEDWSDLRFAAGLDEMAPSRGVYVINPLSERYLKNLKDGNGLPLWIQNPGLMNFFNENGRRAGEFDGTPVEFSEAMNGPADDAVSTPFAIFGNFSDMYFGEMEGIVIDTLDQATISDPDGGSDINLATQDYVALRVKVFVEVRVLFENSFSYLQTAAS